MDNESRASRELSRNCNQWKHCKPELEHDSYIVGRFRSRMVPVIRIEYSFPFSFSPE